MVKHIVLFRLNTEENAADLLSSFKQRLESLPATVPGLISIEVGINGNANEKFSFGLTSTHTDWEALQGYATHPDHLAVAVDIRKVVTERACIDYEC